MTTWRNTRRDSKGKPLANLADMDIAAALIPAIFAPRFDQEPDQYPGCSVCGEEYCQCEELAEYAKHERPSHQDD